MPKWKTKKGKILNMSKMETGHIFNCIRMLEQRIKDYEGIIIEIQMGPTPNGEMAQMIVEQGQSENISECENIISGFATKIKEFKEELEFRGVKYA